MGNINFMSLPHGVDFGSEDMAAGLERRRQEVLRDPWRPRKMALPWPEPSRDAIDQAIADGMLTLNQRGELAPLLGDNVLQFKR